MEKEKEKILDNFIKSIKIDKKYSPTKWEEELPQFAYFEQDGINFYGDIVFFNDRFGLVIINKLSNDKNIVFFEYDIDLFNKLTVTNEVRFQLLKLLTEHYFNYLESQEEVPD